MIQKHIIFLFILVIMFDIILKLDYFVKKPEAQSVDEGDAISANIVEDFERHFKMGQRKFLQVWERFFKRKFDWNEKARVEEIIIDAEYINIDEGQDK